MHFSQKYCASYSRTNMLRFSAVALEQKNSKHILLTWNLLITTQQRFATTVANSTATNNVASTNEWQNARPLNEMPSPKFFETIRSHLPGGKYYKKDTNEMLALMNKEYGDAIYLPGIFGKEPAVATFNPNDFETVFRNEGIWPVRLGAETLDYHRKHFRADFFKGIEGLITTQGEPWGKFRSAVNPVLMQPKNVRLYLQKMSQVNQEFIEKIREIRDVKTQEMPADFVNIINRWTLESVSIVALDKQLGLLRDKNVDPLIQKFLHGVTDFVTLQGELDAKPSVWRIVSTPKFKRLMKALDNILEITSLYITETMQRLELEKKNGVEKPENEKGVLEKLLKIDPQIAKVMAMDMLMAGVDTTSGTFTGIMLCLAKNPEKQEKLREEVRHILPNKDSDFNENSLNNMPYLRACIKESLRLYPLVIGNGRMTQRDIVISGYKVPKGAHVVMLTTSVNYDEKHYSNPHEFIPERWLRTSKDEESKTCPNELKSKNPFVYLPFGFGPRSCIGRRIAEMELELGIARIIRNFNVSFNYPTEKAFKTLLINVPNIPLKFKMTDVIS